MADMFWELVSYAEELSLTFKPPQAADVARFAIDRLVDPARITKDIGILPISGIERN